MLHIRVMIDKGDGNTKQSRGFPAWEIPILEHLFGEGNVTKTGESEKVMAMDDSSKDRPYPNARDEYIRLENNYGSSVKDDTPYVAAVYGTAPIGLRELQKAIDGAKEAEAEEDAALAAESKKPKVKAAPVRNRRVPSSSAESDAMLS